MTRSVAPRRVDPAAPPEVLVVPEVLADRDAEPLAAERHESRARARLEVAPLVEHVVRRQEALPAERRQPAAREERGDVVVRLPGLLLVRDERADEERRLLHPSRQVLQDARRSLLERGAVEEVLRRIAADRELGDEEEVGLLLLRARERVEDLRAVPREVAERRVELREREAHQERAPSAGATVVRDTRSARVRPFSSNAATRSGTPASAPVSTNPR